MSNAFALSISSLVLGILGSLMFIIGKIKGVPKNSLLSYGSKSIIGISIIVLNVAVIMSTTSKSTKENFVNLPLRDERSKDSLDPLKR
jgi:membrane-bound ClpP family serine protease